jgi:prolyl-tRNA synthetase
MKAAEKVYEALGKDNCLLDDRDSASTGEKFADADLIGCPVQIVISRKTLENNSVEVISRNNKFDSFMCGLEKVSEIAIRTAL